MTRRVLATVALAIVAVPTAAQAAPAKAKPAIWPVYAGEPDRKGAPEPATTNEFWPSLQRVHVGDTVEFRNRGFHNVVFLGGRNPATLSPFGPDPAGGTYAPLNDAAGQPFHFGGKTKFVYNVAAFMPSNPRVFTKAGVAVTSRKQFLNTGVFGDPPSQVARVRFPKAGVYTYVCTIHPGMTGQIAVRPKAAKVPTAAQVQRAVKKNLAKRWKEAAALLRATPAGDTVWAGAGSKVTVFAFVPAVKTVKAGTTVTFRSGSKSEPHNVGFGPEKYIGDLIKSTDMLPFGPPGTPNQVSPIHFHGSDPVTPGTPWVYNGANHGNGFLASPLLMQGQPQVLNSQVQITFTTPGEYTYYCPLHFPDMKAKINVTA